MKHSTLFIDESGKSSLADPHDDQFILTGVILDDDDINTVEGFFSYIKRKYKINSSQPFHSYEIFEGVDSELSPIDIKILVETMADFIDLIPIKIKVIKISKKEFKKALGVKNDDDLKGHKRKKELKEFPYRIMATQLFQWFAQYLNKNQNIGQIIVDAKKGSDDQLIKTLNLCKEETGPLSKKNTLLIKERCSAICFAEKSFLSGGLEITDLISYTCFLHVRKVLSDFKEYSFPKLFKIISQTMGEEGIEKIVTEEIRAFFQIGKDGVHKYLKSH